MVIATLRRTVTGALRACARLGRAVSVFLFFNRQWFPVRRWLGTDYAVFDARDARVGRPGLTALVPKSFHIARPAVIVQQNEHLVSRCGTDVPPFAHSAGPSLDSVYLMPQSTASILSRSSLVHSAV